MRNVTTPRDDRINEVVAWFFNQIKELMRSSPYSELVNPVDTAGYIYALLLHAAFASVVERLRMCGREQQAFDISREMAASLFGKLNELIIHNVTNPPTNDIERN